MEICRFDFLTNHFPGYKMKHLKERDRDLVEIINPFYNENIRVEYIPEDDFTPYVVSFAFQHCHMCDEEDVLNYVNSIIQGNLVSIEFFNNGTRHFGGDIAAEELDTLTYEKIMEYWGIPNLLQYADSFQLRDWHGKHNFEFTFVVDENGLPAIKKLG